MVFAGFSIIPRSPTAMLNALPRNHTLTIRTNLDVCRIIKRPIGHLNFRRPTLCISTVSRIRLVASKMMLPVFANDWPEDSDDQTIEHNHLQKAHEQFELPMGSVTQ